MVKAYVRTESGSLYLIDGERWTSGAGLPLTWERVEETKDSGLLRTDGGDLVNYPEIKLGQPMLLLGPPIVEWAVGRLIMTTPVKSVTYSEDKTCAV
jgi:hypothetical protein